MELDRWIEPFRAVSVRAVRAAYRTIPTSEDQGKEELRSSASTLLNQ